MKKLCILLFAYSGLVIAFIILITNTYRMFLVFSCRSKFGVGQLILRRGSHNKLHLADKFGFVVIGVKT